MNPREYETMYRVEATHWWYQSLRGMILDAWQHTGLPPSSRLLDVGCGTGATMAAFEPRATVTGVDRERIAVQFCRTRGLLRTGVASVANLPFPSSRFDAAFLMDVLYHRGVPDKSAALREVRRVLEPGGLLFVNVPAYQWLHSSHDAAIHTDHRFTRTEIVRLLSETGFGVLRATYWNTLLFPLAAAVRLMRRWVPVQDSDLASHRESWANSGLAHLLRTERILTRIAPLPFGLSIFVVARAE